ncbi:hypothetical protein N431DRAFT_443576 [Stipitochalara longipes BDJ]|nr:hypothetical protein N431DRAFT_443576 [Stipitochalara longipes BDJ]
MLVQNLRDSLCSKDAITSFGERDSKNPHGFTDEERYDDAIGKIARALPQLEILELANYDFQAPPEPEDSDNEEDEELPDMTLPWGKALRWEAFVERRYWKRKAEEKLKTEKEMKNMGLEMQLNPANCGHRGGKGRRRRGARISRLKASEMRVSNLAARYNTDIAVIMSEPASAGDVHRYRTGSKATSFKKGKKFVWAGQDGDEIERLLSS